MENFWSKVELDLFGCWTWSGATNSDGYGITYVLGGAKLAHRVAWLLTWGSLPNDLLVRHNCANPLCVRPDHLKLGTVADNNRDTVEHGNHFWGTRTECLHGHPYTEATTRVRTRRSGQEYRVCLICQRVRQKRYKEKGKTDAEDCSYQDR